MLCFIVKNMNREGIIWPADRHIEAECTHVFVDLYRLYGSLILLAEKASSSVNLFDLNGKVAIVTGASRGIGAAIAVGLAQSGADVLLVSRSEPRPDVVSALQGTGRRYEHCAADLSQMGSIDNVVQSALTHFGSIDILVNNAGIIRRAPFLEHTEADWDEVHMTNLKVPVFLAQCCARQMVAQDSGGKIINICSILSYQGGINVVAYTSSKHAIAGATKAMANELAPRGINVNGIAPGYVKTENTMPLQQDTNRYNAILARIPRGRWAEASDMVGAAVFLASPASDYVNGEILNVDGGWMTR
jgi:2-dehydro-3-deoxy-D-gluconate 5-dehydrogenase